MIVRQNGLSSASSRSLRCRNTRVTADLVDPGGGRTTDGASQLLRRPVTVPHLGTDSEDLVCRCITSKSGNVTKETQSSFTDDVGDVEQARTTQNLIVKHEIVAYQLMCKMRRWHRRWKESNLFQSACVRVQVSEP